MSPPIERTYLLTACDTLFFRDGRPFEQDDEGLAEAGVLYPPTPRTMAGALRAAIARVAGWRDSEHRGWKKGAPGMPGWGADLGGHRFRGPFPTLDHSSHNLVLPVPAHLGVREENRQRRSALASPGRVEAGHDAAPLELLCMTSEGRYKPYSGWLIAPGMQRVLRGLAPDPGALVDLGRLTALETRIGLRRNKARHVAEESMLYVAGRHRPHDDEDGARTGLIAAIEYPSEPARRLSGLTPVGGDTRMAEIVEVDGSLDRELGNLCVPPDGVDGVVKYVVVLLTPALVPFGYPFALGSPNGIEIPGLPGVCCAVASGRAAVLGGWRGGYDGGRLGAVSTHAMMPAGTVLFMRTEDDQRACIARLDDARRDRLGDKELADLGYGEFVYGKWPQ